MDGKESSCSDDKKHKEAMKTMMAHDWHIVQQVEPLDVTNSYTHQLEISAPASASRLDRSVKCEL